MWLGGGRETAVGAGGDGDMGRGDDEGDEDNGAAVYRQWLGGGRPAAARPDDEPVRDGGGGGGGGGDWVCACGASRNGDELAQSVGAANRAYSHGRALLDGADGGDDDGADLGRALVLLRQAHSIYRQILQQKPRQPDALHLLGSVIYHRGAAVAALPYLDLAVAVRPDSHNFLNTFGACLAAAGARGGCAAGGWPSGRWIGC